MHFDFARHILSDLAIRKDANGNRLGRGKRRVQRFSSGETARVPLSGEHISYGGEEPYQGNDASFRLTMAVTAIEMSTEPAISTKKASRTIADMVLALPADAPFRRFRRHSGTRPRGRRSKQRLANTPGRTRWRGGAFADLEMRIRDEEQRKAAARREREERTQTPSARLGESIRKQVGKFRKEYPNWRKLFDMWFGGYLYEHRHGNTDYLAKLEVALRERLALLEQTIRHNEPFVIWGTVQLAGAIEEQGKHAEAVPYYRLARMRWHRALLPSPEYRREAIDFLNERIVACSQRDAR